MIRISQQMYGIESQVLKHQSKWGTKISTLLSTASLLEVEKVLFTRLKSLMLQFSCIKSKVWIRMSWGYKLIYSKNTDIKWIIISIILLDRVECLFKSLFDFRVQSRCLDWRTIFWVINTVQCSLWLTKTVTLKSTGLNK